MEQIVYGCIEYLFVGGVSALDGLIVVLVITAATFAANVLAGVIALQLIRSSDPK